MKPFYIHSDPNLNELPEEQIPAAIAQLAAAQAMLAARLLANGNGVHEPQTADRLLTAKEAAPLVGVSADYLYSHAEQLPFSVKLPAAKTKSASGETKTHLRFSAQGIQRWIKSRAGR